MAVFTIGSSSVSGNNGGGDPPPSGGAVGGADNLTNNGAITQVSGAGVISESFVSQSGGTVTVQDTTAATGDTKLVVKAGAGQASNLQEWQANDGAIRAAISDIDGEGTALFASATLTELFGAGYINVLNTALDTFQPFSLRASTVTIEDITDTTGSTKLIVKAGAGQDDNLYEAQAVDGSVVASISQLGGLRTAPTTAGDLPAAAAGNAGTIHYVTDATATTIGSTVAGGGANKVLVWSNGAAWHIMAN